MLTALILSYVQNGRNNLHGGKDKTNSKETMCNARAWFQQCWKSCAYESSEVALRFDDHGMKEMMRVVS